MSPGTRSLSMGDILLKESRPRGECPVEIALRSAGVALDSAHLTRGSAEGCRGLSWGEEDSKRRSVE